jgi:Cys-tRNA(Pro)/Cys-tRNA(Cys) deacylase
VNAPVPQKTNATRLLVEKGVRFELRAYEVDEADLSAETVAAKVGLPSEQVYKTLLFRGDKNGLGFAVVAAGTELDPKALAKLTKDRKVDLVPLKEIQPSTGYIRGGVTVFGARKDYPVYADEGIVAHDVISVSAGVRGTQILLDPRDYVSASRARLGPIARR